MLRAPPPTQKTMPTILPNSTDRMLLVLRSFALAAGFLTTLLLCPKAAAQSSVRGPLQAEHNPAYKFQSFPEARWDSSSFAPPGATQWWQEARFGMFIHFGVASLKGAELGWGRGTRLKPDTTKVGPIPDAIYDNLYKEFTIEKFDAAKWVRLARETGMKYIVVITKHHDGFHMWDTEFSDYKITNAPFGRDYLKELVEAARAEGMPIGFYFAQREWYHPHYDPRGAYPGRDHRKYIEYQFNAVRELLTKYGKIDILWFDAAWWGGMFLEEDWDSERLYRMARELQPHILINNRASIPGDFDTPEQHVGGFQTNRPWESCVTLTSSWGHIPNSPLKTPKQVIELLVQCVTGDGNLMLNVGPLPTGEIAPKEVEVLQVVGDWMAKHGESIYGTRGGPLRNASWGGTTSRGDTVYVHVLKWPGETLRLRAIEERVVSARALTGGEVKFQQGSDGITLTLPVRDQHPLNTVIALTLDRPVSKIYDGQGTASIFDGPGYGDPITQAATFEVSSSMDGKPIPASDRRLFTGESPDFAFRTASESNPWVVVDLGAVKNVKGVRITNRPSASQADGLELLVSDDKSTWTSVWKAAAPELVLEVPVTRFIAGAHIPGVPARYLKLQHNSPRKSSLALRQVEVFGEASP
jgi:alpha-L-fucosidase